MENFKEKLARFMDGRYGTDQLHNALLVVAFVLMGANIYIRSSFISILLWAILIWLIFRAFSRDNYKISMENEKFMKIWNPVKAQGSLTLRRIKEIKTHRFRKCPHCKAVLRLPRKTGKHTVNCPRCHDEFAVRIIL